MSSWCFTEVFFAAHMVRSNTIQRLFCKWNASALIGWKALFMYGGVEEQVQHVWPQNQCVFTCLDTAIIAHIFRLFISHLQAAGRSRHEVSVNIGLLFSGCRMQPIPNLMSEECVWGGGGFQNYSSIQQAVLIKHTSYTSKTEDRNRQFIDPANKYCLCF